MLVLCCEVLAHGRRVSVRSGLDLLCTKNVMKKLLLWFVLYKSKLSWLSKNIWMCESVWRCIPEKSWLDDVCLYTSPHTAPCFHDPSAHVWSLMRGHPAPQPSQPSDALRHHTHKHTYTEMSGFENICLPAVGKDLLFKCTVCNFCCHESKEKI